MGVNLHLYLLGPGFESRPVRGFFFNNDIQGGIADHQLPSMSSELQIWRLINRRQTKNPCSAWHRRAIGQKKTHNSASRTKILFSIPNRSLSLPPGY
jgi:hypothetical protein